ncbi:MAG TPA: hypothetical protein VNG12_27790, partial [Acidimicrobiales bacterium]|nr:hypothetical protein [Acidimicrobiales bacterium]
MTEMRDRWGADHHEHHFPCDCGDWHYLDVSTDEHDPDWQYLEIADTFWPTRWRDRIKAALTVLRAKPHHARALLLNRENVRDLKEVIDALAARYEARS